MKFLLFHRAAGFVHQSIPDAVAAIESLATHHGYACTSTEDPDAFSAATLNEFDAAVFLQTSGNVLPKLDQRSALESYIREGGGYFGIHAAASMGEYASEWPWYRELVGASFKGHTAAIVYGPDQFEASATARYGGRRRDAPIDAEVISTEIAVVSWQEARVTVEAVDCLAAKGLASSSMRSDEWYGFDRNPRGLVNVVATVDESTYDPGLGAMGADHPIVWWRHFDGGRSVYNSMGHSRATWRDPTFLQSVAGGIELAAGG